MARRPKPKSFAAPTPGAPAAKAPRQQVIPEAVANRMVRRIAIATGYSGNMDFMTAQDSFHLPWRPVPIDAATLEDLGLAQPADGPLTWAEVDGDALEAAMRTCLEHWDTLEPMRQQAAAAMRRFCPDVVIGRLQERLAALVPGAA